MLGVNSLADGWKPSTNLPFLRTAAFFSLNLQCSFSHCFLFVHYRQMRWLFGKDVEWHHFCLFIMLIFIHLCYHLLFCSYFELIFSFLFNAVLSCGKSVKYRYRFTEFVVFDYGSFPYSLSLFFWLGVTFPLVALDKITHSLSFSFIFFFKSIFVLHSILTHSPSYTHTQANNFMVFHYFFALFIFNHSSHSCNSSGALFPAHHL